MSARTEFKTRAWACPPACFIKCARFAGCFLRPGFLESARTRLLLRERSARWIEPHLFALVSQLALVHRELWLSACVGYSLEQR